MRSRRAWLTASSCAAAIVVAGCGSSQQPAPKLPHDLGASLAAQTDQIAAAADRGDPCTALSLARGLQSSVIAAINAHRVPGDLQEPLQTAANGLVHQLHCVQPAPPPPPPPPPPEKHHGKGHEKKHHGKGHEKKHHGKGHDQGDEGGGD
jgi:hypothetical protein